MAKRKATNRSKMKSVKRVDKIKDKDLRCVECGEESSIKVAIQRKQERGIIRCTICNAVFVGRINKLETHIDLYSQWVDQLAKEDAANFK